MSLEQYSRAYKLLGEEGLNRLREARVGVFGLGGVGSYAAEALARCGIGNLVLIDDDIISISNLNRQIHANYKTIGVKKTQAMEERISSIDANILVTTYGERYTPDNSDIFFQDSYDYVIDAIDDLRGKISLAEECNKRGIPLISCMGTANKLHPEKLEIADIFQTSVCPLARAMRQQLKKSNIKKLRVVYSKEEPIRQHYGEADGVLGSVSFVPPVAGMMAAGVVIRFLAGVSNTGKHG